MEYAFIIIGILLLLCLPGLADGVPAGNAGGRRGRDATETSRRDLIRALKVRCEDEDFTLLSLVEAYNAQPELRKALNTASGYYFANVFKMLLSKAFQSPDAEGVRDAVRFLEGDHPVAKILRANFRSMIEDAVARSSSRFLLESPCAAVESALEEMRALTVNRGNVLNQRLLREWFKVLQRRKDSLADPDARVDPAMADFLPWTRFCLLGTARRTLPPFDCRTPTAGGCAR